MKKWNNEYLLANTNLIWSLLWFDESPIEQKSNLLEIKTISTTIHVHKLFQLSTSTDPKESLKPNLQHPNSPIPKLAW
jgi:hypothetical protein